MGLKRLKRGDLVHLVSKMSFYSIYKRVEECSYSRHTVSVDSSLNLCNCAGSYFELDDIGLVLEDETSGNTENYAVSFPVVKLLVKDIVGYVYADKLRLVDND